MSRASNLKSVENEPLIESSFRRLLASIESEREKIRSTWQELDGESNKMHDELDKLRQDTDEYCQTERKKIDLKWKDLDKVRMATAVNVHAHPKEAPMSVNCSGTVFQFKKSLLNDIEGSLLNHMFSEAFVNQIPLDENLNYFLDFNPTCFEIIVRHLQSMKSPNAPIPRIPPEQQLNMDLLVEALRLQPFMQPNRIMLKHGTSLKIKQVTSQIYIEAQQDGWQMISAQYPLSLARTTYFDITLTAEGAAKGGLAFGVCGHQPTGVECNHIRLKNAVMYKSGTGLVESNAIAQKNVPRGITLKVGDTMGLSHDVHSHSITFYHNKLGVGSVTLNEEAMDNMQTLYPVFGLCDAGLVIQVDFTQQARH